METDFHPFGEIFSSTAHLKHRQKSPAVPHFPTTFFRIYRILHIVLTLQRCSGVIVGATIGRPFAEGACRDRRPFAVPDPLLGANACVDGRPRHTLRLCFICHRQRKGSWPRRSARTHQTGDQWSPLRGGTTGG